ncbi:MAG: PQQ-binding-like beta-propeller repeat protein [Candidatus Eremiobacteraeota bacterium]|nr:PQQ-binding-like beta-propeller repeat protein [Candidatus Eremiobacteraeota bacterium]
MAQWLQFGYDSGHTGYNPLETTINAGNVGNLQIAWNNQSIIQPNGIVVDKGTEYVDDAGQSNSGVYALDASTGAQKWYANVNLNFTGGLFNFVAAVAGNIVVSPCSNSSSNSPSQSGLCGLNAKTGNVLWKAYCTEYQSNPCNGLRYGGTSPALYGGRIYFQSTQGINEQPDTQALDPKTGAIAWDVPGVYHCPDGGDESGNPLPAANGLVFAVLACQGPSGATEICAFSATSGSAAWCVSTANIYVDDLRAGAGKVYFAEGIGSNNVVIALDAKSGAQSWMTTLPLRTNYEQLATANGRVFVAQRGAGVTALSATSGKLLWTYSGNVNFTNGTVLSIANGIVYDHGFGGNNGDAAITALSETTGALISTSSAGNGASPAADVILDGTVYAGCYTLCAFTLGSAKHKPRTSNVP